MKSMLGFSAVLMLVLLVPATAHAQYGVATQNGHFDSIEIGGRVVIHTNLTDYAQQVMVNVCVTSGGTVFLKDGNSVLADPFKGSCSAVAYNLESGASLTIWQSGAKAPSGTYTISILLGPPPPTSR